MSFPLTFTFFFAAQVGAQIFIAVKYRHFSKAFLLVLRLYFAAHLGAHYILCCKMHTFFKTFPLTFAVIFYCAPRCADIFSTNTPTEHQLFPSNSKLLQEIFNTYHSSINYSPRFKITKYFQYSEPMFQKVFL